LEDTETLYWLPIHDGNEHPLKPFLAINQRAIHGSSLNPESVKPTDKKQRS